MYETQLFISSRARNFISVSVIRCRASKVFSGHHVFFQENGIKQQPYP